MPIRICERCECEAEVHRLLDDEDNERWWCVPCIREQSVRRCDYCSERLTPSHYERHDYICEGCLDDHYASCEACGNWTLNCDAREDSRGRYLCCECYDDCRTIRYYSTRAEEIMAKAGRDGRYLGVELEVECSNCDVDCAADEVQEIVEGWAILKEDGSLNDGFEIVTRPQTLDYHRKLWRDFCDKRPRGLRSFNTDTCGLHVHADRKGMTALSIGRVLVFINEKKHESFIRSIAGRPSVHWAKIMNKKLSDSTLEYTERYEAVNICPPYTIEFRIFKGTLKYESIMRCIEFVDAVCDFCQPANKISINAWRREVDKLLYYFQQHVADNRKRWPNLHKFLRAISE